MCKHMGMYQTDKQDYSLSSPYVESTHHHRLSPNTCNIRKKLSSIDFVASLQADALKMTIEFLEHQFSSF